MRSIVYTESPWRGYGSPPRPQEAIPMFRILYLFVLENPPSWVAYVHTAVLFALMGLTYIQASRRGIGFMIVFLTMAGIFMIDVFAYVPFLVFIKARDRKRAAAVLADGAEARSAGATVSGPEAGPPS
jgi:hypothetical protein